MARKPHRRETRYVTVISVHVPMLRDAIDMMRYDSCYPSTEDESRKLWALSDGYGGEKDPKDHLVQFTCAGRADNTPTVDRWRSFGCTVFGVRSLDEPLRSPDELLLAWRAHQAGVTS
jgi:hypothetical protein